ncbi:NAD-dependent epimerase/dehydratase family protein [Nocardia salmonicida]|uniref:NAD-dependent epimerase/dehydratase family protein n=1 Tax=Nocardia salmonicida TaxID=53431 RepID=A0ABZ1N3I8_9NOCA
MTAAVDLAGAKILIVGPHRPVSKPITLALAESNEVWGLARFSQPQVRAELETAGVRCVSGDPDAKGLGQLPADFDYVLNFVDVRSRDGDFNRDLTANAEATGLLMRHCRDAKGFLHWSTTGVYHNAHHVPRTEDSPLGDHHRSRDATYSIVRIACEAVVRTAARLYDLPSTIGRLGAWYGPGIGWPAEHLEAIVAGEPIAVHPDGPNTYSLIHQDDYVRMVPALLRAASVPATVLNWAGEPVSIEDWCAELGELVGRSPIFDYTEAAITSVVADRTRLHEIAEAAQVPWRAGLRELVRVRHPELLRDEVESA